MYHDLLGDGGTYSYTFFTLPDTWFVRNSIKYAYSTYMQAHEDELRAGVRFARWHDFTIDEQNPDGVWEPAQQHRYTGDAWESFGSAADEAPTDTQVTKNDGSTAMAFRLMGSNVGAYNIFSEYAKLRQYSTADDTSVTSDQPYDGLLDLKDADKMAEVGDRPPYDLDFSGWLHDGTDDQGILVCQDSINIDTNSSNNHWSTRVFTAPLGLVWILKEREGTATEFENDQPELLLHVSPGKYKGVKAPSLV
jgi:hypothetical protein